MHEISNPVFWENENKILKCRLLKCFIQTALRFDAAHPTFPPSRSISASSSKTGIFRQYAQETEKQRRRHRKRTFTCVGNECPDQSASSHSLNKTQVPYTWQTLFSWRTVTLYLHTPLVLRYAESYHVKMCLADIRGKGGTRLACTSAQSDQDICCHLTVTLY